MNAGSAWRDLARNLAFIRHVPLAQILRRLRLSLRRKWRDRTEWPVNVWRKTLSLAADPPLPLFAPRKGMIALDPAGSTFTFLGRAQTMPGAVDWQAPSLAPADQLWRMHLHYMEYLEEVDDTAFVRLVDEWIGANAPMRKGAWRDGWNAYALSLRVTVWMQQLATGRKRMSTTFVAKVRGSLAEQLTFLAANLETDIGGNHLIKNIKALIWGSSFFAGEAALAWRRLALRKLVKALDEQALADGVHYERSPSYHMQVFADLLECRHALPADEIPPALDSALRAMAAATLDLTHPDGRIAQFNDSGLRMAYSPAQCLDAFAAQFGFRPEPRPSIGLSSAGYYGLRGGDNYLIIDCGRIGPDALPAHAHGDILSFEWSVAGERIIVDPGVYEYYSGPRRAASRSAASHNTLCFDGVDQADFFGSFRCGRRPEVSLLRLECDDERLRLEGTHDGYRDAGRHIRRFEASPQRLTIVDRIEARRSRRASVRFLLHPDVAVEFTGETAVLTRGRARIRMRSSVKILLEDAAWWPDLGYERATKRLRLNWGGGNGEIATHFEVEAMNAAPPPDDGNRDRA